jgi:hypothetical protein
VGDSPPGGGVGVGDAPPGGGVGGAEAGVTVLVTAWRPG